jgi:cell division protein FtsA
VGSKSKIENSLIPIKDTHCDNPKPTFSGLALAWVGINDSEQEKGVLFIDFGAGTTEYLLLQPPDFFASGVIAVGCDHIANDLALVLELSFQQGQDIFNKFLKNYGCDGNQFIDVTHDLSSTNHKTRKILFDTINDVVELRIEELFKVIKKEIRKKIPTSNPAANYVVITGGGSLIPITKAKANEVFKTPVRINTKNNMKDFSHFPEKLTSPNNSTLAGLLVHASKLSNKSSFVNMLDRSITVQISELFKKIKTAFKI